MTILITNDDGIFAPALHRLREELAQFGRVVIVAPDRDQSATSHSLTLHRPFRIRSHGHDSYSVDGTPTDCVVTAYYGLLEEAPGMVISGINHGPNMGEDVLYSGTVSAAMEGVTLGIPGVAISFTSREVEVLLTYRELLTQLVRRITGVKEFPPNMLLNVNLPAVEAADVRGVKVTKLGSRFFSEGLTRMKDPWGREVFWIGGGEITWTGDAESDHQAVHDGYISITPLHMDLTDYGLFETVRRWALEG